MRVTPEWKEEQPSLPELKAMQRMKEFQIKKLVEVTRIIPNLNLSMINEAVKLAGELVLAEQALQQAQYKVQDIKNNLARLV